VHTVDEVSQRLRVYFGIGINLWIHQYTKIKREMNTHHQADLKEVRRNTHQGVDLPEQVEIKRGHPIVICDAREKVHENKLAISFATVSRLFVAGSLGLRSALDNNDSGRTTASNR
jgi:hypothetical protein